MITNINLNNELSNTVLDKIYLDSSISIGYIIRIQFIFGGAMIKEKRKGAVFSAKDVAEIVGLSYRQLNDWEMKGFQFKRSSDEEWRRFTVGDLFALLVIEKLRDTLGTPVKSLSWLYAHLTATESGFFQRTLDLIKEGKSSIYLLTDFERFASFAASPLSSTPISDYLNVHNSPSPKEASYECVAMVRVDNIAHSLLGTIDPLAATSLSYMRNSHELG